MAEIHNLKDATVESASAAFAKLDIPELHAQEITQQGAIHAIATLLQAGCTEANAMEMLVSLRANAELIRQEFGRRGVDPIFDQDQTQFS